MKDTASIFRQFGRFAFGRILGVLLLLFLLALRVADPEIVSDLRFSAFDLYQQMKPREPVPVPVTIVDIDDPSLSEIGQWPWPRSRMAELVDKITGAGAVAIAFDIVFSEPDRLSPDKIADQAAGLGDVLRDRLRVLPNNDEIFASAIASSRVILGQTSIRFASAGPSAKAEAKDSPHAVIGGNPVPFLQSFPDLLQNLPVLEAAAAGRGMFSVRPDSDGIYRRVPIVMLVQNKIRLSLAPELLRVATGGDAFAIKVNEAGIEGVILARQLISTASDGTVWPYFSPSLRDRYVSATNLLNDRIPDGRLAGHLVLVGTSAIGLEDFRPTPLGIPMPGVEIHAQLLENILTKSALLRPNYSIAVELVAAFLLSIVVIVLAPRSGARVVIILGLVLVVLSVGGSYYLFTSRKILLDPVWPSLCVILSVMLMSSLNYLREERQRRRIRSAFGQYVSPDLVARLAENRDELALGGERRDLSVLFCDVRGFTTLAESYRDDPVGLTSLMNEFLTVLSNAVLVHNGTIDKFMGDAVMAFWNAPLDTADHEHAACRAALQMVKDIQSLNETRIRAAKEAGEDVSPINVGVGINSGECIVGNMGSDTRFDYTAIGDEVNLSSRLEGQSKTYGMRIVLGDSTARKVEGDFALLELDLIRVKGKTLPVLIFGLVGGPEMQGSKKFADLKQRVAEMRNAYNAQNWDAAMSVLDKIAAQAKALDIDLSVFVDLYRVRIAGFVENPPGKDWDCVYTAATK